MTEPDRPDPPPAAPLRPRFESVLLVCKACEKRSKGPKKSSARAVGKQVGRAHRDARWPRTRVVLTSCLGACPKKAFTVAAVCAGRPVAMVAFRPGDDAAQAVDTLFGDGSNPEA